MTVKPESKIEIKEAPALKRTLSLFDAIAISVGSAGAGIFIIIGTVAGLAGPALFLSVLIAGAVALLTAFSMTQITARYPEEGGVYVCVCEVVSPFIGFLTGWMWLVSNTFMGATVSMGFAHYLAGFFPSLPFKGTAIVLCLLFAALNISGMKFYSKINNALVLIKISVLLFFVGFGAFYLDSANLSPFDPLAAGVVFGAYYIFFAFAGFARVSIVAGEIENAAKNVPRAILSSLGISAVIYTLVGLVAVGLAGAAVLAQSTSPLSDAIMRTGSRAAVLAVSAGAVISTANVLLTDIMGVSRMAYALAGRGDLPAVFRRVYSRFGTPFYGILIFTAIISVMILFIDIRRAVAMSTFASLLYYSLTNISVLRLQPACAPAYRVIAIAGVFSCLGLLGIVFFLERAAWIVGTFALSVGVIYYAVRKRFHP